LFNRLFNGKEIAAGYSPKQRRKRKRWFPFQKGEAQKFPFAPSERKPQSEKPRGSNSPPPQPWYAVGHGGRKHLFNYKWMESRRERFIFCFWLYQRLPAFCGSF